MKNSRILLPNHIEGTQDHLRAVEFMKNATAKDGVDYKWVWEYAKELWELRSKIFNALDDKADGIIKYLGGGTGLFAIGLLAKIDSSTLYLIWWSLPAIVIALTSIFFAALVRKPNTVPSLPTVQDAMVTYANESENENKAIAAFLGQWNLACEDMKLACLQKAKCLTIATWLYFSALVLVGLPLIAFAVNPLLSRSTSHKLVSAQQFEREHQETGLRHSPPAH